MSAKQNLQEYVDGLNEADAASLLRRLRREHDHGCRRLTPADRTAIERGLADAKAGRVTRHDEVRRRFQRTR